MFLVGIYLVSVTTAATAATKARPLCADSSGIFLGLSTDEDAYKSHMGFLDSTDSEDMRQSWTLTHEDHVNPHEGDATPKGPQKSYDGRYLQVLEDSGRTYPPHGEHIEHARDLDKNEVSAFQAPYVTFLLTVTKEGRGVHTLFLRWTGGDTVGGGDSLYVVMYKKGKKGTKTLVTGQQTVKPAVVPIETGIGRYAGCCYDMVTHACPCFSERPSNATCADNFFISTDKASTFGVQCRIGGGAMTIIKHPEWYLYAGQEAGDVMDFDSEPWDVTCEADGSNTRDSGHDFPSWELEPGDHELRIYAREDGTALDGIYVAGPTGSAPTVSKRYSRGDSTFCPKPPFVSGKTVGMVFGGLAILGVVWFSRTSKGSEIFSAVLSKPSMATRYIYVEGV